MTKKIIIIGAGIAGLSAGCYAEMNGYDAVIFELHNKPGGVCTSWNRKGFTFDYCIHNLVGTGNTGVKPVWDELHALKGTKIINHPFLPVLKTWEGIHLIYIQIWINWRGISKKLLQKIQRLLKSM